MVQLRAFLLASAVLAVFTAPVMACDGLRLASEALNRADEAGTKVAADPVNMKGCSATEIALTRRIAALATF
ncbi:MAG: hypothetical protein AAAB14_05745, partial [Ensifer adhaerens]